MKTIIMISYYALAFLSARTIVSYFAPINEITFFIGFLIGVFGTSLSQSLMKVD